MGKNKGCFNLSIYHKQQSFDYYIQNNCTHTNLCQLSQQRKTLQLKKGGTYISKICDHSLFTLHTVYQKIDYLTNDFVKEILQLQFPKKIPIRRIWRVSKNFKTVSHQQS